MYYFGTKSELLDHVLGRRSSVLNEERMQRLDQPSHQIRVGHHLVHALSFCRMAPDVPLRATMLNLAYSSNCVMLPRSQGRLGWTRPGRPASGGSAGMRLIATTAITGSMEEIDARHGS